MYEFLSLGREGGNYDIRRRPLKPVSFLFGGYGTDECLKTRTGNKEGLPLGVPAVGVSKDVVRSPL